LLLLSCSIDAHDWSSDDFSLFDLVEEVNENFYSLFAIAQDATTQEIKKAYRRLSLEFHPDRNPEGEQRFRQIAAIYDILKTADKRSRYDQVLEFGLPDWRQPIFYYRRARKLSLAKTALLLLLIVSTTHYLMLWGAYFDKYLTLSTILIGGKKKAKQEKAEQAAAHLATSRPRWTQLIPCQMALGAYSMILATPDFLRALPSYIRQIYGMILRKPAVDENSEEEFIRPRRPAIPQPVYEYEVATDVQAVPAAIDPDLVKKIHRENDAQIDRSIVFSKETKWTVGDLAQLVKLSTEKYPVGTPNRWELMARCLRRSPEDVACQAGKLKMMKRDEYAKLLTVGQTSAAVIDAMATKSIGEDRENSIVQENGDKQDPIGTTEREEWSQMDQRMFETALVQFPKGTADRWDKICKCIPSKTKEHCMDRFKTCRLRVVLSRVERLGSSTPQS